MLRGKSLYRKGPSERLREDPGATLFAAGSEPVGENQLDQAGDPVGIELIVADFVFSVFLFGVVAPVGLGAVEVGEAVLACERPRTEYASAFVFHAWICGEGYYGTADEAGGFGNHEIVGAVVLVF